MYLECGLDPALAAAPGRRRTRPRAGRGHRATSPSQEDLDHGVDVTTVATIPEDAVATADFTAREAGVVAGLRIAEAVLSVVCTDEFEVERHVEDGDRVEAGQKLLTRHHPHPRPAHRRAQRAQPPVPAVRHRDRHPRVGGRPGGHRSATVRDTRKTTPGLRALEKYAVRCGGGVNHRMSLSDAALVKDNHVVAAGGVAEAFEAVREAFPDVPIEVEVDTLDQVREVARRGRRPDPAGQLHARRDARRPSALVAGGPCWRPPAGSPWTTPARTPRPASTTSRSARSPTPRRSWTSASTCASGGVGRADAAHHRRRQHPHRPRPLRRRGDRRALADLHRRPPHRRRARRAAPGPDGHAPAARRRAGRRHRRHRDLLDRARPCCTSCAR